MRFGIAYGLFLVAALLVIVAVGTIAYDVFSPTQPGGTNLAQHGARAGAVIGMVLRTAVLAAVAFGLCVSGLRILNPAKYSPDAADRRRLLALAAKHDRQSGEQEPAEAAGFVNYSDGELVDIYRNLNRTKYEDRFRGLVWVICQRCAEEA